MKIQQWQYLENQWATNFTSPGFDGNQAQLVLAFGHADLIICQGLFKTLQNRFPNADIACSSTAGEIINDQIYDNSVVVTAIQFEKTKVRCCVTTVNQHSNSYETGKYLMKELLADDLSAVFAISDGTHINGSELVIGLNEVNAENMKNVPITGGLAGDGARFEKTVVGLNQMPSEGVVVVIGFYGNKIKVGHGSFAGWEEFGPIRTITRSGKNILHEIDGRNALDLYKEYLGPYKDELPGSALLFPLSLKEKGYGEHLVRTILSINEHEKSMLFAGNLPQGSKVRLMKANVEKLIEGASMAAQKTIAALSENSPELILLISCIGRKLVLQDRTDEEVEAVKKVFGNHVPIAGFYSYGEISPFGPFTPCELHNQTMTITTFSEL